VLRVSPIALIVAPHVKSKDVKSEIKAALHRCAELEARNIDVDSADSTVTLHPARCGPGRAQRG
jgi:hypothetical protein